MNILYKKVTTAAITILLSIMFIDITYAETLIYKDVRSGIESYEEFEITKLENKYIVKVSNSLNKDTSTYDTDLEFSLLKWRSKRPENGTDITAKRVGDRIYIQGRFNGEDYEKEFKIDESPWYQEWGLGLRTFITSDKDTTRFWSIDPDKLRIAKFEAKKERIEMIDINGQKIESTYVKLTLAGWMKPFWSGGEMWFRNSDGLQILSKMNAKAPKDKNQLIQEK